MKFFQVARKMHMFLNHKSISHGVRNLRKFALSCSTAYKDLLCIKLPSYSLLGAIRDKFKI